MKPPAGGAMTRGLTSTMHSAPQPEPTPTSNSGVNHDQAVTATPVAAESGANHHADNHHGRNGTTDAIIGERPDLRKVVVEAVEVAAERGLPLAADVAAVPDLTDQTLTSDAGAIAGAADGDSAEAGTNDAEPAAVAPWLPHTAPWDRLPPDVLSKVTNVDIMRSLISITPRMKVVEKEIERLVTTPIKLIADIASHTLNAGGKRLRPALTLLVAELCGDTGDQPDPRVVICAAAIELTHTTTLLHDDVVDEAETRRGKPTANLLWGNQTSVLVGDYLFAQVFVTAAQEGFIDFMQPLAMATAQMCAGELLETQTRSFLQMTEKQYREIIALKTAALTECACRLGAMAMDADSEAIERLSRFGHDVGMAFQIVDDVFDITTTESRLGKPVGNDIRAGDITLPMLRAMKVCGESEQAELQAIIGKRDITEPEVARALDILRNCDAVPYSLRIATDYIASAKAQLEAFPPSPARAMLYDIADYVVSREK
jgi:geranylgeranyl pyrophosphate synthase